MATLPAPVRAAGGVGPAVRSVPRGPAGTAGSAVCARPVALWRHTAAFASAPGECRRFQEKFMKCLRRNNFENALCRHESKDYLECRMERQVRAGAPPTGPGPAPGAGPGPASGPAPIGLPRSPPGRCFPRGPCGVGSCACARELIPRGTLRGCVPPSILSADLGGCRPDGFRPRAKTEAVGAVTSRPRGRPHEHAPRPVVWSVGW